MTQENILVNIKVIFYATKLRFPKYPPLFYFYYMYVNYVYLLKRKKQFRIINIPDDALLYILNKYSTDFNIDCNDCLIVSSRFCREIGLHEYAKISGGSGKKIAKIFAFDIPYDVVYISDTLRHNFNRINIIEPVSLTPIPLTNMAIAEEVQVALLSSGHDINNYMCDVLLKNYFRGLKLVRKDDIFAINVKKYAPEFIFNNFKTNLIENVYFKCVKIKHGENEDCRNCTYFCVKGETELKQCAHAHDYIPAKFKHFIQNRFDKSAIESSFINKCPCGLEDRLDRLRKAINPFLKRRNIRLKPIFLIQGNKGNAKNIVVTALAEELGLNLYRISSYEVSANAYSQTEIKIKNAFFKAKLCAPSVFVIDNFENFGKNHEGRHTERIIDYFKSELSKNLTNNYPPIIVVCIGNSSEIPVELSRVFLEIFEFGAPNPVQRRSILEWTLQMRGLDGDFDVKEIAEKCHGFLYGDLDALVYHAHRNSLQRRIDGNDTLKLTIDDFNVALDKMQANYTESMGAPKVPKVRWSDVGGLSDVKAEIIRTINLPLKRPELLRNSGLRRSGILLYGPPGTGKTLLAKAVATECGLCFLSVKGPELLNMYVGQSERNIREVFERAREASPCIIFFDELDSLAPNRGVSGDSGGVMDRVVSQLLSEMDGLNKEATVFIIGATNRPDLIDPALLRPGRFDKLLYVGPAETHEAKVSVLKALTRNFRLTDDIDLESIVRDSPKNISGADFYGICSNAWMSAVRGVIKKIEDGKINKDDVAHENVIVGAENFKEALARVKPSISREDMKYFERLKLELSSTK